MKRWLGCGLILVLLGLGVGLWTPKTEAYPKMSAEQTVRIQQESCGHKKGQRVRVCRYDSTGKLISIQESNASLP